MTGRNLNLFGVIMSVVPIKKAVLQSPTGIREQLQLVSIASDDGSKISQRHGRDQVDSQS